MARQIVLTIPITHVTLDQVINLSLADGQIIPTTVGELLKLAMPKSVFDDDVTGGKYFANVRALYSYKARDFNAEKTIYRKINQRIGKTDGKEFRMFGRMFEKRVETKPRT